MACGVILNLDTLSDGPGVLVVTLLLPTSRLAELEVLAARRDTTASTLIRRVVCCSLLRHPPGEQPPNET